LSIIDIPTVCPCPPLDCCILHTRTSPPVYKIKQGLLGLRFVGFARQKLPHLPMLAFLGISEDHLIPLLFPTQRTILSQHNSAFETAIPHLRADPILPTVSGNDLCPHTRRISKRSVQLRTNRFYYAKRGACGSNVPCNMLTLFM